MGKSTDTRYSATTTITPSVYDGETITTKGSSLWPTSKQNLAISNDTRKLIGAKTVDDNVYDTSGYLTTVGETVWAGIERVETASTSARAQVKTESATYTDNAITTFQTLNVTPIISDVAQNASTIAANAINSFQNQNNITTNMTNISSNTSAYNTLNETVSSNITKITSNSLNITALENQVTGGKVVEVIRDDHWARSQNYSFELSEGVIVNQNDGLFFFESDKHILSIHLPEFAKERILEVETLVSDNINLWDTNNVDNSNIVPLWKLNQPLLVDIEITSNTGTISYYNDTPSLVTETISSTNGVKLQFVVWYDGLTASIDSDEEYGVISSNLRLLTVLYDTNLTTAPPIFLNKSENSLQIYLNATQLTNFRAVAADDLNIPLYKKGLEKIPNITFTENETYHPLINVIQYEPPTDDNSEDLPTVVKHLRFGKDIINGTRSRVENSVTFNSAPVNDQDPPLPYFRWEYVDNTKSQTYELCVLFT